MHLGEISEDMEGPGKSAREGPWKGEFRHCSAISRTADRCCVATRTGTTTTLQNNQMITEPRYSTEICSCAWPALFLLM